MIGQKLCFNQTIIDHMRQSLHLPADIAYGYITMSTLLWLACWGMGQRAAADETLIDLYDNN